MALTAQTPTYPPPAHAPRSPHAFAAKQASPSRHNQPTNQPTNHASTHVDTRACKWYNKSYGRDNVRLLPRRLGLRVLLLRRLPRLRLQTLRLLLRQLLTAPTRTPPTTRGRWRGGRVSILLLALLTCGAFERYLRKGRARWLKTRRTGPSSRAPLTS